MPGLVEQLQTDALDERVPVSVLLRKMKLTAVKLQLSQAVDWVEAELVGYKGELPDYRQIRGQLQAWNPYHGWQHVGIGDSDMGGKLSTAQVGESLGSLESLLATDGETLNAPIPDGIAQMICKHSGTPFMHMAVHFGKNAIVSILDHVRNLALNWALDLERAGIFGEGINFSRDEQNRAMGAQITIGELHGNFHAGDVSGPNARANLGSTDNSTNTYSNDPVFSNIETAITNGLNVEEAAKLIPLVHEMRDAISKGAFTTAYQRFIAATATYMTIVGPFLPALSVYLSGGPG